MGIALSRKKACSAEIRVSAQLRRGVLEVQQRNEVHNHKLSEHVWKHLPENRRLDQEQESKVISMTESHVPTNAIKKQLSNNSLKVITSKDVANIRQKYKKKERGGQMINHVLAGYHKNDANLFVDVATFESGWIAWSNILLLVAELWFFRFCLLSNGHHIRNDAEFP